MIISRTPFRVSLFGGILDRAEFFSQFGATIIGFTIDKYCYVSLRDTPNIFKEKFRLFYSKAELVNKSKEIQHNGIRGVVDYFGLPKLELSHISDIPSQTGLGSSSSFVVGMLNGCSHLIEDPLSKKELAERAIFIERDLLEEPGGIQDQIWAAYGGFNSIHIDTDGSFMVRPMPISTEFVEAFLSHCFLYYVGNRQSFDIAQIDNSQKVEDDRKRVLDQTLKAYEYFESEDIHSIGCELNKYWQIKAKMKEGITNSNIDVIYNKLIDDGMVGGKLLGSGGSGFIFGVLNSNGQAFRKKYYKHLVPFNIDYKGSVILNASN